MPGGGRGYGLSGVVIFFAAAHVKKRRVGETKVWGARCWGRWGGGVVVRLHFSLSKVRRLKGTIGSAHNKREFIGHKRVGGSWWWCVVVGAGWAVAKEREWCVSIQRSSKHESRWRGVVGDTTRLAVVLPMPEGLRSVLVSQDLLPPCCICVFDCLFGCVCAVHGVRPP